MMAAVPLDLTFTRNGNRHSAIHKGRAGEGTQPAAPGFDDMQWKPADQ